MKTSLGTLGAAMLLSLTVLTTTSARAQTASQGMVFTPNSPGVKVIDNSTANTLSVTMVGKADSAKNTAASTRGKETSGAASLGALKPESSAKHAKTGDKKAGSKATEKKKITTTR